MQTVWKGLVMGQVSEKRRAGQEARQKQKGWRGELRWSEGHNQKDQKELVFLRVLNIYFYFKSVIFSDFPCRFRCHLNLFHTFWMRQQFSGLQFTGRAYMCTLTLIYSFMKKTKTKTSIYSMHETWTKRLCHKRSLFMPFLLFFVHWTIMLFLFDLLHRPMCFPEEPGNNNHLPPLIEGFFVYEHNRCMQQLDCRKTSPFNVYVAVSM